MNTIAVYLIRIYRAAVSPFLPSACRFYPTCSAYAEQAIQRHGWFRGARMSIIRIGRCRPMGPHGYDPVP